MALTREERQRAENYRFERHRNRWVTSRYALRHILSGYTGEAPERIEFSLDIGGKPRVIAADGRDALHFNLSHTERLAVVAVAVESIGIDVEHVDRASDVLNLARRFFYGDEIELILKSPAAEQSRIFMQIWTRKEAYIKARGLGLSLPLSAFGVTFGQSAPVKVHDPQWDDGETWYAHELLLEQGSVTSLVYRQPNPAATVFTWPTE